MATEVMTRHGGSPFSSWGDVVAYGAQAPVVYGMHGRRVPVEDHVGRRCSIFLQSNMARPFRRSGVM